MPTATFWEKAKWGSKSAFDKTWKAVDKLGAPVNKLSNKLGSEAFWPTTLDKESDKAARILKSFCKDGFYAEEETKPTDGPTQKQRVVKKIPPSVIKNAKGLAIFTTMRTGLWMSGAGGSGILIGRKEDGTWSPPSGIILHTAGLGFLVGVDIYDCVVVINTQAALDAFSKIRCTLGGEVSAVAGPVGAGGLLETELHKRRAPIFTYLKSRGFYAGVQIDGTIVIERTDENERFYGQKIGVGDIMAGKVRHPPYEIRTLMETVKVAQGDSDVNEALLTTEPPPGDYKLEDGHMFGVPEKDDPDPYGVLALEKEGMEIREASTKKRASWVDFSFQPAPSSPLHSVYGRNSQDKDNQSIRSLSRRSSWRLSAQTQTQTQRNSNLNPTSPSSARNSTEHPTRPSLTMHTSTQTEFADPPSPSKASLRSMGSRMSHRSSIYSQMADVPEHDVLPQSLSSRQSPQRRMSPSKANGLSTPPQTPSPSHDAHPDGDAEDEHQAHFEEPTVHSIQTAQPASPQVISKARIVTVPKRVPPKLPPRNPNRSGKRLVIDASPTAIEGEAGTSPTSSESVHSRNDSHQAADLPRKDSDDVNPVMNKLEDVQLDEDEDEEDSRPNPLAQVEEKRRSQRSSEDVASSMPGGWA